MRLKDAVYCLGFRVIYLKEAINTRQIQVVSRGRCDSGKYDVTIALHSLFKATEQHMKSDPINLAKLRAVQHHARTVIVHATFQLSEEMPPLLHLHGLRQLGYGYRAR
jgi:hypothetical protein